MSTKLIRRALIASGLFIGTAVAFSPTAFADTTGSVVMGGSVTSTLNLASVTTAGATALDLDGDGTTPTAHIVQVADLTIGTNNEQGYTLTATAGSLAKAGGTSIAYQVTSVANGEAAPAIGDFSAGNYTVGTTAAGETLTDLYIKYTPAALQDAGAYAATITLNVVDKT
ncbi:hypothetical protein FM036_46705 [Nostoc sp. HG1]|nr:hypothetical protein [Nostoc sp. HG1]